MNLPVNFDSQLESVKVEQGKTIAEWEKLGVKLPPSPKVKMWVVIPDDPLERTYLVTENFRTIMYCRFWGSTRLNTQKFIGKVKERRSALGEK